MVKTSEQIQAMKADVVAWFRKYGFEKYGWCWDDPGSLYDDRDRLRNYPLYLSITYDGDLADVMRCASSYHSVEWQKMANAELNDIIRKHGCWMESVDVGVLVVFDQTEKDE
jgi:hypothetical protein